MPRRPYNSAAFHFTLRHGKVLISYTRLGEQARTEVVYGPHNFRLAMSITTRPMPIRSRIEQYLDTYATY